MTKRLSTRNVFVAVLLLGWFALAARNVADPDVWWHLKTGEYIVIHRSIPHADPFSYTREGQPWVAHEWLSDVLIYLAYNLTGWAGLIAVFAAVVAAAFFVLYLRTPHKPYIAGLLTLWGAFATRPLWGVRPQVLSLLLSSVWLLLLERSEQKRNLLWWTLPLTVLWVNLHAGFALGLALLVLFLLGELCEGVFSRRARLLSPRMRALGLTFVVDLLLVLVNPNGARLYGYPFETLRSPAIQSYIAEWASPNFHRAEYWPCLLLFVAVAAALTWSPSRPRAQDVVLLLAGTFAALVSVRFITLFVLVAVPALARTVSSATRADDSRTGRASLRSRRLPYPALPNAAALLAMAAFTAWHVSRVVRQQASVEAETFPAAAVSYLESHSTEAPIFNHYDWGGYLIWRLYPEKRVFIDGRADVYGDDLFQQFADAYRLRDDWKKVLDRWHIRTVIVPVDSALAVALRASGGWTIRYRDDHAIILERLPRLSR